MRRLIKLLRYVAILLLLLTAIGYWYFTGPFQQRLRVIFIREVEARTGLRVAVKRLRISAGRVTLREVALTDGRGAQVLSAPEIVVLLGQGRFPRSLAELQQIREVDLTRPTGRVVRERSGAFNIEQLLQAQQGAPTFTGRIRATDGALEYVDQTPGGATTKLEQLDLDYTVARDGVATFSLEAKGGKQAFGAVRVQGRRDPRAGTHVTGQGTDIELRYAMARLPRLRGVTVSAGRAEASAAVSVTQGAAGQAVVSYDVRITPRRATISFPWLKRPITEVAGQVRMANGDLTLHQMTGRLMGSPVTAEGRAVGFPKARLDLAFMVSGIQMTQVKALVPGLTLPSFLTVTAPAQVSARATGVSPAITVTGRAAVGSVTLANIPWHDMVASFTWKRGEVTVTGLRAHGSPRQLEGSFDVRTGPGKRQTRARVVMRNVPLALLRTSAPELKKLDLGGTADLAIDAQISTSTTVTGHFKAHNARYQGYRLGEVSGDFSLSGQQVVQVTNGRIAGPTATGAFSGKGSRTGAFTLEARLRALEMGALGIPGLTGNARGTIRATGSAPTGKVSGHVDLALSGVADGAVRGVVADFALTREQLALTRLTVASEGGGATGALNLTNWRAGRKAGLSGALALTEVRVGGWLPASAAALLPRAAATGTVTLGGRVGAPRVAADLRLQAVKVGQVGEGVARVRLTYEAGDVQVEEFTFEGPGGTISGRGSYTRLRGLDLTIPEARTDLSAISSFLPAVPGLQVSGAAVMRATVRGRPEDPEVSFGVTAEQATIGGREVNQLAVVGAVHEGLVTLEQAGFEEDGGRVSLTGTFDLRTRQMDLHFAATDIDLARLAPEWLEGHTGLEVTGRMTAKVEVTGPLFGQTATFSVTSPELTANGQVFREVTIKGEVQGTTLNLQPLSFKQEEGEFSLRGTVGLLTGQMDLTLELSSVDIEKLTLVVARAAARLHYLYHLEGSRAGTDRPLEIYNKIPGPLSGRLGLRARITGRPREVQAQTKVRVEKLGYGGRTIDEIAGAFELAAEGGKLRRIGVTSLNATQEAAGTQDAASASVSGEVVIGGETNLTASINNLGLPLLQPWFPGTAGVTGKATIEFDVTGETKDPEVVGSVAVTDFKWGGLQFENALIYPVRLQGRVFSADSIMLQNGPMQGTGEGHFELSPSGEERPPGGPLATAAGELHITNGSFAPVKDMEPAEFNADLFLRGRRLILRGSPGPAPGPEVPGVRGQMGKGAFSVSGEIELPETPTMANLPFSRAEVRADLDPLTIDIPNFARAQLSGKLLLGNHPRTGRMQLATPPGEPLTVADGTITAPPAQQRMVFNAALPVAPALDLHLVAGERLRFTYPSIAQVSALIQRAEVDITGQLQAQLVEMKGEAESRQGRLAFPNGRLDLVRARVSLSRDRGKPLQVRVDESEAVGQVGDYQVVLRPQGQVYPPVSTEGGAIPFDLNAASTPFLGTPYIMALLMGPVISPGATGVGLDPLATLTASRGPTAMAGTLTGVMLPGPGGQNLALDYSFEGPLSLRLRERLVGRLYGQYITPLTGPAETRRLVLTYQVTPRYSFGFSENGLGQSRWQVQSFFGF